MRVSKQNAPQGERIPASIVTQTKSSDKSPGFTFRDERQSTLLQRKLIEQAQLMHAGSSVAQLMDGGEEHEEEEEHHHHEDHAPVQGKFIGLPNGVYQLMPKRDNFTAKQRTSILAKNKTRNGGFHVCAHCGFANALARYATRNGKRVGDGDFQIDHIIPASRGGRALISNGRVLCGTCNTSRGNRGVPQRFGINKWRALHRKRFARDYKNRKRKY